MDVCLCVSKCLDRLTRQVLISKCSVCVSLSLKLFLKMNLAMYEAPKTPLFYILFVISINIRAIKNLNVAFLTKGP